MVSLASEAFLTSTLIGLAVGTVAGLGVVWFGRKALARKELHQLAKSDVFHPLLALLDSIDDLAWIKDKDCRFILVNRKFSQVFGVEPNALIGKTDFDLSKPELARAYQADDKKVMQTRTPSRQEEAIAREGHRFGWSETIKVPVFDKSGAVVGTAGVARDITERHEAQDLLELRVKERTHELTSALAQLTAAQAALVQREKMAALGSLVAGIAHELNTPIGNALTVASTLQFHDQEFTVRLQRGLTKSDLETYLSSVRDGSNILLGCLVKASDLISSFKQVAMDQTSMKRRRFDLAEVVAENLVVLSPTLRKTDFTVESEVADKTMMDSYPGPLGQVITNLVSNALLHAFKDRAQGRVTISAKHADADWIELRVEDDGIGIPQVHLPRIFDPFFTTKFGQGGSGLGLSIVYSIVQGALSGTIAVTSNEGSGTCFSLRLPRVAPENLTNFQDSGLMALT